MAGFRNDSILDDRETVLDRLEERVSERDGPDRPLRERTEDRLDEIPSGPGGLAGNGNVLGIAGYYAISAGQLAVFPVPGVKQPGYSVISHGTEEMDEFERHTIRMNAASRQVAEIVAEYKVSAPSNIDFFTSEVDVVSIEKVKDRPTYPTWEVEVDVADRGQKEF